jgi:hypothetical protein
MDVSSEHHALAALSLGKLTPMLFGYEVGWYLEAVWTLPLPEVKCRLLDGRSVASSLSRLPRPGSWVVAFFQYRCSGCASTIWSPVLGVVAFTIYEVGRLSRSIYWIDKYVYEGQKFWPTNY